MERRPQPGELYRHFKNKMYQIIGIATHSETKEELVIYQAMYGDFGIYARPLDMFVSEVDHAKYPEVRQQYRFERVESSTGDNAYDGGNPAGTQQTAAPETHKANETARAEEEPTGEEEIHPKLMEFLETEDYEARYNILVSMRNIITDSMIDAMAVVIDVTIPEGNRMDRYEDLKKVVRTRKQYECVDRLR